MADNYQVKDGNGALITMSSRDEGSNVHSIRITPRVAGADVSSSNPMPIVVTGSDLSNLNAKTPALGPALRAASTPVTIATDQPAIPVSVTSITGGWGPTDSANLTTITTRTPALGQAVMAASVPVVIASNQTAVAVSLAGVATAVKQPNFGTAGVASPDVLTVQGILNGTPIPVTLSSSTTALTQRYLASVNAAPSATDAVIWAAPATLTGYTLSNLSSSLSMTFTFYNASNTANTQANIVWRVILAPNAAGHLAIPDGWRMSTGLAIAVRRTATNAIPAAGEFDWSFSFGT